MFQGILRELGEGYTFEKFMMQLEYKKLEMVPTQTAILKQRLDLLNSFLDKNGRAKPSRFVAGQLTIVDLSDTFIDSASACAIFEILVRLFVRAEVRTGKVLVIDEAHKVLNLILNGLSVAFTNTSDFFSTSPQDMGFQALRKNWLLWSVSNAIRG